MLELTSFQLAARTAGEQKQAVAADFNLVEISQALRHVRGESATVHGRPVPAAGIHDGANRPIHPDPAVHLAHLLVFDREVGFLTATDESLRADDAVNEGRIIPFDDQQSEEIRRPERGLPLP